MQTGKLPDSMEMDNNDDPFSDDEADEPVIPVSSVKLPFTVGTLKGTFPSQLLVAMRPSHLI